MHRVKTIGLARLLLLTVLFLDLTQVIEAQSKQSDAEHFVHKAKESAQARDFEQAADQIKKALALTPGNETYLALAGEYEFKAGRFADGRGHAVQALQINGKNGSYHVLAGLNAFWDQNLDEARTFCDQVIKAGPKVFGAKAYREALYLKTLAGTKEYTLLWKLDPKKGRPAGGVYAVALPKDGLPYQSVSFEMEGAKSHRFVKGEVNDFVNIIPQGTAPLTLTMKVTTQPYGFKKELARPHSVPLSTDAKTFLGPIVTIDPKSATLKKVVTDLKGEDAPATVRKIMIWLNKNIDYKLEQKDSLTEHDFKNVDDIVKRGYAECRGYALLFTGLCRAANIPARPIWGLLRVPPGIESKYGMVSHNWAEVYIAGSGWIPVDPQRPETFGFLPNNYVRFVMDARKSATSTETLPVLNLMSMNGGKLKFEEK